MKNLKSEQRNYFVYLLGCADGTYYTGYTTDLSRRLAEHNAGKASRYTRGRLPVKLLYQETLPTQRLAMQREYRIKQLKRKEKEGLCKISP